MELKPQPRFSDTVPVVPGVSDDAIARMDQEWQRVNRTAQRLRLIVAIGFAFLVYGLWAGWL